MAARGAKPKAAHLRLVDGTHRKTRHGDAADAEAAVERAAACFGPLKKPSGLKQHAAKAWKQYIEPAGWLDASREPLAIAFCELWQEFRMAPMSFPAAKLGQMRACMSELGLTDERNRVLDVDKAKAKDEHFD